MKLCSVHFIFAAFVAALSLAFLAPQAARAFTIDNQSSTNFDGSPKFADPDQAVQNFGAGGARLNNNGGPTAQFGVQRPGAGTSQNWDDTIARPYSPWTAPRR
jgi:hypothetical protein